MNSGVKTIIYPVKDIAQAKTLFTQLLGVEPFVDASYYVGFMVGDQQIGLDPNGHSHGMTGPIDYYDVDDIEARLQLLIDAGAVVVQPIREVGGGKRIATVTDADGNTIGLSQSA